MYTFLEYCSEKKDEKFDWIFEALGFGRMAAEYLKEKFGSAPYRVDDHLIQMLANSQPGSMSRRQAMDAIKQRHGMQIASWMEKFLDSGGHFDPEQERTASMNTDDRGTWY